MNAFDREHLWHPYTSMTDPLPAWEVASASGVRIRIGTEPVTNWGDEADLVVAFNEQVLLSRHRLGALADGAVIRGYIHPRLNRAIKDQLRRVAHVMFGGFTHEPAISLGRRLVDLTPEPLQHVFFSDSGSVAVEVAIKMALQYWQARGKPAKRRLLTLRGGYHGDTFGAMAAGGAAPRVPGSGGRCAL